MTIRVPQASAFLVGNAIANGWRRFFDDVAAALNNEVASIETSVPNSRLVNKGAGLQGGGALAEDIFIGLYKYVGATAGLPTTGNTNGDWAYATDACNSGESSGSGTGCPVCWGNGTWRIPGIATVVGA